MKNLLIPMAGKSTRFPNMRPKWMLTHPYSNNLMCVQSILGINLDFFDKIYFIFLKEHEQEHKISEGLLRCLKDNNLDTKSEIIILDKQTSSQSETIYNALKIKNIEGFILIKDADGYFEFKCETTSNQIVYCDLNDIGEIEARSKSYIQIEKNKIVTNIIEKRVISSFFCVGGYAFESAELFIEYYNRITKYDGECYISNVIFELLLQGHIFKGEKCNNFVDWGTKDDWHEYCSKYKTLFIDLDGVLISNTSQYIYPYIGSGYPMKNNIDTVKNKYDKCLCKIIITTSRPEQYRDVTIAELNKYDIKYDMLIMGLPHCQRILINDFSTSNSYPSAKAINIERNTDTLKNYL